MLPEEKGGCGDDSHPVNQPHSIDPAEENEKQKGQEMEKTGQRQRPLRPDTHRERMKLPFSVKLQVLQ